MWFTGNILNKEVCYEKRGFLSLLVALVMLITTFQGTAMAAVSSNTITFTSPMRGTAVTLTNAAKTYSKTQYTEHKQSQYSTTFTNVPDGDYTYTAVYTHYTKVYENRDRISECNGSITLANNNSTTVPLELQNNASKDFRYFDHIDISATGTFHYTVDGTTVTKTINFMANTSAELGKISVYKDTIDEKNKISVNGKWQDAGTNPKSYEYRISGIFPTASKYIILYEFTIDVYGKPITLTYKHEYSFFDTAPYNICPGIGSSRGLDPVLLGEDMTKYFSTGSIMITKTVTGLETPGSFTFSIAGPTTKTIDIKSSEFKDGTASVTVDSLPIGTYIVTEGPANTVGYSLKTTVGVNDKPVVLANSATVVVDRASTEKLSFKNEYTKQITGVTVVKEWRDNDNASANRPSSVKVQLYANGTAYGTPVEILASADWQYTWSSLPAFMNSQPVTYTVAEVDVPMGYSIPSYDYSAASNGIITIKNILNTTCITVNKIWDDNNNASGNRPESIQVQLYANGRAFMDPISLVDANAWEHTWQDLPQYIEGKKITYTVKEADVPSGYSSKITTNTDGSFTITNTYTNIPKTGDTFNPTLYIILAACALLLSAGVFVYRRKIRNN